MIFQLAVADQIINWFKSGLGTTLHYIPKIIIAILIFIIGKWLIGIISKFLERTLKKRNFDPSLQSFLASVVKIGLMVLLLITVISTLGVDITSIAALLAGAGLAIGAALNGTLSNFASGVMILIIKPFKVGDLISAQDKFGLVEEIGIMHTIIVTSTNHRIHLPNGKLSTEAIDNFSQKDNLRIDLLITVADDTDIGFARKIALEMMASHPNVISDPAPDIKVTELMDNGIKLVFRPRIKIEEHDVNDARKLEAAYYSVYFGVREAVKVAFQQNGIQRPATSMDVNVEK